MSDCSDAESIPDFCPGAHSYAVIRMDPVAMVEHLNDPEALALAKALQPKLYVVYVDSDHSLPFPGLPWYGFDAQLIAPSPPPADDEQGLSPSMCTPIYPNGAYHPDRPPLVCQSPESFPYTNCYHWPHMDLDIRILARPEGFDQTKTAELPPKELLRLRKCLGWDRGLRSSALKARRLALGLPPSTDADGGPEDVSGTPGSYCEKTGDVADEDEVHSIRSFSSGYSHSAATSSTRSINMMDGFFGDLDQNTELLPLVHLWVDMAAHLKQEDIPDPRGFFKERDSIVSIIQAARARNPSLPRLLPPMCTVFQDLEGEEGSVNRDDDDTRSHMSEHSVKPEGSGDPASDRPGPTKTRQLRPLRLLRKISISMRQIFRLPYLPIWP